MYRIPTKPRVVDGRRRSYGGTVRDEALRLKMSAPVKLQNSSKVSGFRNKLKNLQKNIRAISKSRLNYRKVKLSTSNVDVVGRVLNKVDGQSEYLMLHSSRPRVYQQGYERSQDMYDSFVKSKIAVCDEVKRRQDVFESLVNLRESVSVSRSAESQFKDSVGENTSLDLNEEVCCSVDDDGDSGRETHVEWSNAYVSERNGLKMKISRKRKHEEDDYGDSGRERHVDEWSNAYIFERNGLKMKISRKRKHEEDAKGSGDETNGTSPLNIPLPKKGNGTSPLNTPLPNKVNRTSPLNTPLPKKIKRDVI